jgi:hypothetical protein
MGIEIGAPPPAPTPGARLYVTLSRGIAALSMGERMQLLNAFNAGVHFVALPPKLRVMFDAIAATITAPSRPGEPW